VLETCISVRLALHSTGIMILFIPTGKKGREITESREFHTVLTERLCDRRVITQVHSFLWLYDTCVCVVCVCVCVPQGFITVEWELELTVP